jgi:hypothetical protein
VIAGVGNYVIVNPSNLGNYVIADDPILPQGFRLVAAAAWGVVSGLADARPATQYFTPPVGKGQMNLAGTDGNAWREWLGSAAGTRPPRLLTAPAIGR